MAGPDYAPFTGFGDDTNSSVKFTILYDGRVVPWWQGGQPEIQQWKVVNGGGRTITQVGDPDPWIITLALEFEDRADYHLLEAVGGLRATLRYRFGITNDAGGTVQTLQGVRYLTLPDTLLMGLSKAEGEPDGVCTADATFQRPASSDSYYGFSTYAEES